MLHKLAAKHLPMPRVLREAVAAKQVALSYANDGSVAYVLRPSCANRPEVLAAIAKRSHWELLVAYAEGAVVAVAVIGAASVVLTALLK